MYLVIGLLDYWALELMLGGFMVMSEFLPLLLPSFRVEADQPWHEYKNDQELIPSLDLSILKMAAEEAIAEVREDGYIGVLVNACRDAAQQYL
jgi:hypothetical protein